MPAGTTALPSWSFSGPVKMPFSVRPAFAVSMAALVSSVTDGPKTLWTNGLSPLCRPTR